MVAVDGVQRQRVPELDAEVTLRADDLVDVGTGADDGRAVGRGEAALGLVRLIDERCKGVVAASLKREREGLDEGKGRDLREGRQS
jgi:hypothetical protein